MKKTIVTSLGIFSLLSWVLFIYLYYFHWQNLAPTAPNPAAGQIYKVNNHGYLFYVNKQQEITAFIPCALGVIAFVTCAILESRWKVYEKIYGKRRTPLR